MVGENQQKNNKETKTKKSKIQMFGFHTIT